ncbi:MAG: CHC2 zinc finger domain-containing protein [Polyangiales bacterium]
MIPDEAIADLRARVDLKALVGEYVRLVKSGASWKGLCPFHNEKSASFYVHPDRGFFHCFGCGASGDVFAFLMRLEGLTFPDAVVVGRTRRRRAPRARSPRASTSIEKFARAGASGRGGRSGGRLLHEAFRRASPRRHGA